MKRAAGFLIFRHIEGTVQYLMLRASYGDKHWTPPKGHVDPGEDEWATALRETCEEAGLKESDLEVHRNLSMTLEYQVKGEDKTVVYWLARLPDPLIPIVLSDEHTDFKWADLNETKKLAGYHDFNNMMDFFHKQTTELMSNK